MDLLVRIDRFLAQHLSPAVRLIFMINCGVFLFFFILSFFAAVGPVGNFTGLLWTLLANDPQLSIGRFMIWQFVTYMFVHSIVSPFHLLFNMLILWFFAPPLERRWGTGRFWNFYLVVGAGAGLIFAALSLTSGRAGAVIGASGAIYGVMLAFAAYYPNAMVYFWGIFPIQMKYLVAIIILFDFIMLRDPYSPVSHLTHIAGLVVAYLYLSRYHRTYDITRWRYRR
jgi:membrane associated rhomboid family serine protease